MAEPWVADGVHMVCPWNAHVWVAHGSPMNLHWIYSGGPWVVSMGLECCPMDRQWVYSADPWVAHGFIVHGSLLGRLCIPSWVARGS